MLVDSGGQLHHGAGSPHPVQPTVILSPIGNTPANVATNAARKRSKSLRLDTVQLSKNLAKGPRFSERPAPRCQERAWPIPVGIRCPHAGEAGGGLLQRR